MEETKRCSCCGRELPLSRFYKDTHTKDGYRCVCKTCRTKQFTESSIWRISARDKTKKCPICGRELPLTSFGRNRRNPDGANDICEDCRKGNEPSEQPEGTKVCRKCGRVLPLTEFYRDIRSCDGVQAWCKNCVKESVMARQRRRKEATTQPPDGDIPKKEAEPEKRKASEYKPVPAGEPDAPNRLSNEYVRIRFKPNDTVIHLDGERFTFVTLTGNALVKPSDGDWSVEFETGDGGYIPSERLFKTKREVLARTKLADIPEDRLTYGNKPK